MIDYPTLQQEDPAIYQALRKEEQRQSEGIELIASENYVSQAVLEAMGTVFTNKYSEGYPGKRYYAGNEIVDTIETTAINRAKELFGAEYVNVQPLSGSPANFAIILSTRSNRRKDNGHETLCRWTPHSWISRFNDW